MISHPGSMIGVFTWGLGWIRANFWSPFASWEFTTHDICLLGVPYLDYQSKIWRHLLIRIVFLDVLQWSILKTGIYLILQVTTFYFKGSFGHCIFLDQLHKPWNSQRCWALVWMLCFHYALLTHLESAQLGLDHMIMAWRPLVLGQIVDP